MNENNQTKVTQIFLAGFQSFQNLNIFLFVLILTIYCVTICGNVIIILLVSYCENLHSPMYFFLRHLSISDIMLTTNIVPSMLHVILNNGATMSLAGCITQFYFFGVSECLECLLLTVMSYDRYLAICNPLRYTILMSHVTCLKLVSTSWLVSCITILIDTIPTSQLDFCGSNVIDHFFCDLAPLLDISCSDTSEVQLIVMSLCIPILIPPCIGIFVSYLYIFFTILRIPSITGRQKAFSTCSSHLSVVFIFFITLMCIYMLPTKGQSLNIGKAVSLLYTVVTPLLNPIIYSLRNKDIRQGFEKILNSKSIQH
ncbi:olfactory receptor 11L1-like [Spea bombifrons]|uniref:olfactory receptor 11L1-like n=1 Tax=Spea bombifrons TaxID=233779 RepID=UPI00234B968E|nr:olfactory receptor 11L1-like [Spea bombifrons]